MSTIDYKNIDSFVDTTHNTVSIEKENFIEKYSKISSSYPIKDDYSNSPHHFLQENNLDPVLLPSSSAKNKPHFVHRISVCSSSEQANSSLLSFLKVETFLEIPASFFLRHHQKNKKNQSTMMTMDPIHFCLRGILDDDDDNTNGGTSSSSSSSFPFIIRKPQNHDLMMNVVQLKQQQQHDTEKSSSSYVSFPVRSSNNNNSNIVNFNKEFFLPVETGKKSVRVNEDELNERKEEEKENEEEDEEEANLHLQNNRNALSEMQSSIIQESLFHNNNKRSDSLLAMMMKNKSGDDEININNSVQPNFENLFKMILGFPPRNDHHDELNKKKSLPISTVTWSFASSSSSLTFHDENNKIACRLAFPNTNDYTSSSYQYYRFTTVTKPFNNNNAEEQNQKMNKKQKEPAPLPDFGDDDDDLFLLPNFEKRTKSLKQRLFEFLYSKIISKTEKKSKTNNGNKNNNNKEDDEIDHFIWFEEKNSKNDTTSTNSTSLRRCHRRQREEEENTNANNDDEQAKTCLLSKNEVLEVIVAEIVTRSTVCCSNDGVGLWMAMTSSSSSSSGGSPSLVTFNIYRDKSPVLFEWLLKAKIEQRRRLEKENSSAVLTVDGANNNNTRTGKNKKRKSSSKRNKNNSMMMMMMIPTTNDGEQEEEETDDDDDPENELRDLMKTTNVLSFNDKHTLLSLVDSALEMDGIITSLCRPKYKIIEVDLIKKQKTERSNDHYYEGEIEFDAPFQSASEGQEGEQEFEETKNWYYYLDVC